VVLALAVIVITVAECNMSASDVLAKRLKKVEPSFTASLGELHQLVWLLIDLGSRKLPE